MLFKKRKKNVFQLSFNQQIKYPQKEKIQNEIKISHISYHSMICKNIIYKV